MVLHCMSDDISIERYTSADAELWNGFVATSKNGTFLHDRGFMEYHSDRFDDHSLIIRCKGQIIALLPADRLEDVLRSHGGLTYGGIVTGPGMSAAMMLDLVAALRHALRDAGITRLDYKAIPHLFHAYPAEEDIYALLAAGARLVRTDLSSAVAIGRAPKMSKSKRQGAARARKAGLSPCESDDFAGFWHLLNTRLAEAHDAAPTHSLDEINLLRSRFQNRIRLFTAETKNVPHGGIVVFDCGRAVHVQYMATTDEGRRDGALDLIVAHLLDCVYADRAWLNFGISTTDCGRVLNTGLARQKEMFGARSIVFQHYEWDVT